MIAFLNDKNTPENLEWLNFLAEFRIIDGGDGTQTFTSFRVDFDPWRLRNRAKWLQMCTYWAGRLHKPRPELPGRLTKEVALVKVPQQQKPRFIDLVTEGHCDDDKGNRGKEHQQTTVTRGIKLQTFKYGCQCQRIQNIHIKIYEFFILLKYIQYVHIYDPAHR